MYQQLLRIVSRHKKSELQEEKQANNFLKTETIISTLSFFSSAFLMAMLTGFSDVTLFFVTWLLQTVFCSLEPHSVLDFFGTDVLQIPHYQSSLLSGSPACSISIFLEASCRNCRSVKVKSYQLGLVTRNLDVVTEVCI